MATPLAWLQMLQSCQERDWLGHEQPQEPLDSSSAALYCWLMKTRLEAQLFQTQLNSKQLGLQPICLHQQPLWQDAPWSLR